ncbi:hypothetical protein BGZ76_005195 [Entomortierella beljakovae]|nr:hypothetical protein BGZ76_005195 [Entomortierella beljakovae]
MFEHEMLHTPAIQRPIYAARNDDVHLRLRCKMTVLDQPKKNQHRSKGDDGQRKKPKGDDKGITESNNSNSLGENNNDSTMSTTQESDGNTLQG